MIRYKKLAYVDLNVSDLQKSRRFYEDVVGLDYAGERRDGAILFRCDDEEPYSVALHRQGPSGFKCAGWTLESEAEFENLHKSLRDNGHAYEELSPAACELRGAAKVTRAADPHSHAMLEFAVPAGSGPGEPFTRSHTKIQRLGHVVWATPEDQKSIAFFRDVLNFRESDTIDEATTFLRPFPSRYHHGIGIGHSKKYVFHHLNFMVSEIDDIGKALHRMRKNDAPVVFGPGRHPASGSVFFYFLEPDGMTLEYSFGMEEFSEEHPRDARILPRVPESSDVWGNIRDPRMGQTGDIELFQP